MMQRTTNQRRSRGNPRHRRGTSLVLMAISMVVMLGMLALAVDTGFMMYVRTDLQRTADACALAAARHLPDTSEAKLLVRTVASENGWDTTAWGLDAISTTCGCWDRDYASFTSPAPENRSTNAIRVTLKRSRATGNPVILFFGSVLGRSEAEITASATALCDRSLCGPFVGIESISVPGSPETDSYDSTNGWYVSSESSDRGGLCSDGPIDISGSPIIRGDARSGKHYDVTLSNNAVVTGNIGKRIRPLNMPPVDTSEVSTNNDNAQIPLLPVGGTYKSPLAKNGNFLLNGGETLNMPPGTYYFNNMRLEGGSVFNITGPTTIYLTGDLYKGGTAIVNNFTQQPGKLRILMTGGKGFITAQNDFYGVIYAPDTDLALGGDAPIYGAVVGKTLKVSGSGFAHYDEALDLEEVELPSRTALVD